MNRRLLVAVGLVGILAALAGCSTILGPSEPDPEQLNATADYEWGANATTNINISRLSYTSVIAVDNRTEIEVYRVDELGTERPLSLSALRFRYPNGTVVNASAMTVENTRQRTTITLPAEEGQVAFTAPRSGKRFSTPVFVEGSHEVTLPEGARVGIPLLSRASPGGYTTSVTDDRMTIHWPSIERDSLIVRYYLVRDLYLFGGLFAILLVAAVGGSAYYLRQIRALERRREEVGLDVETDGDEFDDGGGPPPGMR